MLVLVGCTDMNMNVMNLIWTYESYGFFNLKAELEKNLNDFGVACLQATPKKKPLQKYDCVQQIEGIFREANQTHWLASLEDANINAYIGWWFGT